MPLLFDDLVELVALEEREVREVLRSTRDGLFVVARDRVRLSAAVALIPRLGLLFPTLLVVLPVSFARTVLLVLNGLPVLTPGVFGVPTLLDP